MIMTLTALAVELARLLTEVGPYGGMNLLPTGIGLAKQATDREGPR